MKKTVYFFFLIMILITLVSCTVFSRRQYEDRVERLDFKAGRMRPYVEQYGAGGIEVFETAVEALREGYREGEYSLVSLEDLWTHSLQEGRSLFNQPGRLWGPTGPEETADMIGQTTIGPWQITVWNVEDYFGPPYGVPQGGSPGEVVLWARERPKIQARMIADYIQNAYSIYGKRNPYAIQSYFWLEPFVKGEIGQSAEWWKSPVARPPEGKTWADLTPEMLKDTGFYAKQIICGHTHQSRGLLFWLMVTGDFEAIDEILGIWAEEPLREWVEKDMSLGATGKAVKTDRPGNMEIRLKDVRFISDEDELIRESLQQRIQEFYRK